ncbi:hypothetical protein NHG32_02520 [Aerococcaceae bacterium NML191219]|nr:hypothetical protein [Aerococcaceae bacterium NML191219]
MSRKVKSPSRFKVINRDARGNIIEDLSKITLSADLSLLYHEMIWKKGEVA